MKYQIEFSTFISWGIKTIHKKGKKGVVMNCSAWWVGHQEAGLRIPEISGKTISPVTAISFCRILAVVVLRVLLKTVK